MMISSNENEGVVPAEETPKDLIDEYIEEFYEDERILRCDGFDAHVLGITSGYNNQQAVLAYDAEGIISQMEAEGMDREDAEEYFEFNIASAYMGEGTPIFIRSIPGLNQKGRLAEG